MRDFGEVVGLAPSELRALSTSADAQDRLWAAWALGMALGADVVPFVRDRGLREPDAGVRRHLIVVLAGHKELAALAHLASHDPDPHVRGTAVLYLHRLGDEEIARRAANDESLVVRETAMAILGTAWPDERLSEVIACIEHPSLRETALAILAARPLSPQIASSLAELAAETDDLALWKLLVAADEKRALRDAGRLDLRAQRQVLRAVGRRLTWDELSPLDRGGLIWVLDDHLDFDSAPLAYLVVHLSGKNHSALTRRLSAYTPGDLSPTERALLQELALEIPLWLEDSDGDAFDKELVAALARLGIAVPELDRSGKV